MHARLQQRLIYSVMLQSRSCHRLRVPEGGLLFVGNLRTDSLLALRMSADGDVHKELAGGITIYTRDYDQGKLL